MLKRTEADQGKGRDEQPIGSQIAADRLQDEAEQVDRSRDDHDQAEGESCREVSGASAEAR